MIVRFVVENIVKVEVVLFDVLCEVYFVPVS